MTIVCVPSSTTDDSLTKNVDVCNIWQWGFWLQPMSSIHVSIHEWYFCPNSFLMYIMTLITLYVGGFLQCFINHIYFYSPHHSVSFSLKPFWEHTQMWPCSTLTGDRRVWVLFLWFQNCQEQVWLLNKISWLRVWLLVLLIKMAHGSGSVPPWPNVREFKHTPVFLLLK